MKKVIFNADDFALTDGVSNGIIHAFREGIISSTSIMVNTNFFEYSVFLIKDNGIDVGVHLNLTYGKPLTKAKSLIDEKGLFKRPNFIDSYDLKEVQEEFISQIEKALSYKLNISHLDTHHHIHRNLDILKIIVKLARKYNLTVRSSSAVIKEVLKRSEIKTTDFFIDSFYADKVNINYLKDLLNNLSDGITEFCVHPGYYDKTLKSVSTYDEFRQKEMEIYTLPEILSLINLNKIKIISWQDI